MNKETESDNSNRGLISAMSFTEEEWDAMTLKLEEDAKLPLADRNLLHGSAGTLAMDEQYFEEHLDKALSHSNPDRFVQKRARVCRIAIDIVPRFKPIDYLRDACQRVQQYVESKETKSGYQKLHYTSTCNAIIKGITGLIDDYETLAKQGRSEGNVEQSGKSPKETPKTFASLFINPNDIDLCVDALRQIDPPLISDAGTWIGGKRNQSIIVAWIDVLELKGKIQKMDNRVELSKLLNAHFEGLCLETNTASIFGKRTYKGNDKHADFLILIK